MTRVTKCLCAMVASIVGTGWYYDQHRFGMACALGILSILFFLALLPAADADIEDRYRR